MNSRGPKNIKTIATKTKAATVAAAQGDVAATGGREDVKAVKEVVRFNDVVEVFHFEKTSMCLMLIQTKYVLNTVPRHVINSNIL
nr:expressed protein [Hymenolepis microstoma]CDS27025.1 hypothetical transcript [Hymenolepis microstoma]